VKKKRKTKKILSLLNRLDKLLEEHTDIFFEERPFLGDGKLKAIIKPKEKKRKIKEIQIQSSCQELENLL